jgi:hypothetical protein
VKRIVCAADRASTIVQHGIWDDIKMVTREVENSGGVIIVFYYLRFSVMILLSG